MSAVLFRFTMFGFKDFSRAAAEGPVLYHLTLTWRSDAAFQKPVTPRPLTPRSPLTLHDATFPADAAFQRHILWREIFG